MPNARRARETWTDRLAAAVRAFVASQEAAGLEAKRAAALRSLDRSGFSCSLSSLKSYERGEPLQLDRFALLCRALGASTDAILFGRTDTAPATAGRPWAELHALAEPIFWAESTPLPGLAADPRRVAAAEAARRAFPELVARSLESDDGVMAWASQLVDWFALSDPTGHVLAPNLPVSAAEACRHLAVAIRRATPRSLAHVAREVATLRAAPQLFARAAHAASGSTARRGRAREATVRAERDAVAGAFLACCVGLDLTRPPHLRRVTPADEARAHVLWREIAERIARAAP